MKQRQSQRAFTLSEGLVVMVIIVVLAALLLPVVSRLRQGSNRVACISQMRQIYVGLAGYATENRGFLPPVRAFYAPPKDGTYPQLYWTSLVAPYFGYTYTQQIGQRILRCPARPPFSPTTGSNYTYGLHYGKVSANDTWEGGALVPNAFYTRGYVRKLAQTERSTFLMADCEGHDYPQVFSPVANGYWPLVSDRDGDGIADSSSASQAPFNGVAFPHDGRANFLLVDGSVRSLTTAEWGRNDGKLWGDPYPAAF